MSRGWLTLYATLMGWAQPLLRRKLARRARAEPGYGEAVEERFGRYVQPVETQRELVWVHAVSLGETRAAGVLIRALRQAHPGLRLLLTHGTATGRIEGAALLRPGDVQVWQPWDSRAPTRRFFDHFKPRLGLLMETEVWPCTVATARVHAVPMVLVNARLSAKSLAQALRLAPLARPAYQALSAVLAQTAADAARFAALDVPASVVGNLKFDAAPDADQQALGRAWRQALSRPVLMFASSREGEEIQIFEQIKAEAIVSIDSDAIDKIANSRPRPWVLVVPRHPQRFAEVAALAGQYGLSVSCRSAWAAEGPASSPEALTADVWLGDSVGEMALYYSLADVALLGGSFAPLGGQNLIEAAACACPVVMGPHTFNFADAAAQAQAAGAARPVADMAEGWRVAVAMVQDAAARQAAGDAGRDFANRNRGATQRTVAALAPWLAHHPR